MSKSLGNYVGVKRASDVGVREDHVDQRRLMWLYYLLAPTSRIGRSADEALVKGQDAAPEERSRPRHADHH
jgi:hypothetical protein